MNDTPRLDAFWTCIVERDPCTPADPHPDKDCRVRATVDGLACDPERGGCGGSGDVSDGYELPVGADSPEQAFVSCPRCKRKTVELPGVGFTDPDLNIWWCDVYMTGDSLSNDYGKGSEGAPQLLVDCMSAGHNGCRWRVMWP